MTRTFVLIPLGLIVIVIFVVLGPVFSNIFSQIEFNSNLTSLNGSIEVIELKGLDIGINSIDWEIYESRLFIYEQTLALDLTDHAKTAHLNQKYNASNIPDILNSCRPLVMLYCKRYMGTENSLYKVTCLIDAIKDFTIGMLLTPDKNKIITAWGARTSYWEKTINRDNCTIVGIIP